MLAHVGGVDVRVFQWNTLSETPLELVMTFRHGIRVHLLGGTVTVPDKYLVLTQEDELLWIYTLPTGQFLRNIYFDEYVICTAAILHHYTLHYSVYTLHDTYRYIYYYIMHFS